MLLLIYVEILQHMENGWVKFFQIRIIDYFTYQKVLHMVFVYLVKMQMCFTKLTKNIHHKMKGESYGMILR